MANAARPYAPDGSATTVSSPMSDRVRRSDLLDTYAHPYRRWVPVVLRGYGVHRLVAVAGLLVILGVVAQLGLDDGEGWLALGLQAAAVAAVYAGWAASKGALLVRARTKDWRSGGGELARVRARRPHAGEADPYVAHDEYAVAVSDDGRLVTFVFTPLSAHEEAAPETVLITGTLRYEAVEATVDRFDPVDAARAAEQLADAQHHAARLEAAAISRARAELEQDEEARELMAETLSTGAALRSATGQDAT
jgi:hypothetical protein